MRASSARYPLPGGVDAGYSSPGNCAAATSPSTPSRRPTATPLFLDGKDEATIEHLRTMAPLERLGTPADTAELVAFLAGPARWVNGQVFYENGGVI